MLSIHFLNHASVLIEAGDVRLLVDPWYEGTCFEGGWGLRHRNDAAWDLAASATHLWISHFHGDHFHVPTLKKLLEIHPDVSVLGNRSYNFQLDEAMRRIGFANVEPILERRTMALTDSVRVTRYPTTGIDNMLLVESPDGTVLNYNDCNLPPLARKLIAKQVGPVDVFMTNFNHAGKLLVNPWPGDEEIKRRLVRNFENNFLHFDTKSIFPFASHHRYRAPESLLQNGSMLVPEDLLEVDPRVVAVGIGDRLDFDHATGKSTLVRGESAPAPEDRIERGESVPIGEIVDAGDEYCAALRREFGVLCRLLPPLVVELTDQGRFVELRARSGARAYETAPVGGAHIRAHSEAVGRWFSKIYGTDSFVVGAHFALDETGKVPMKWQIVFGLLVDNKLSARAILGMLVRPSGIQFLWNRREEILGILVNRRLSAEYHD